MARENFNPSGGDNLPPHYIQIAFNLLAGAGLPEVFPAKVEYEASGPVLGLVFLRSNQAKHEQDVTNIAVLPHKDGGYYALHLTKESGHISFGMQFAADGPSLAEHLSGLGLPAEMLTQLGLGDPEQARHEADEAIGHMLRGQFAPGKDSRPPSTGGKLGGAGGSSPL